jgi:hypothetical protein
MAQVVKCLSCKCEAKANKLKQTKSSEILLHACQDGCDEKMQNICNN